MKIAPEIDAATSQVSDPRYRLINKPREGEFPLSSRTYIDLLPDDGLLLSHLAYRALRFARNDSTELPGFNQDRFALYSGANERAVDGLLEEFRLVRGTTIALLNSLDDQALDRAGVADGNRISVRALGYHIGGHELRHVDIVRNRYA